MSQVHNFKNKQGFGLIEVLLATTIIIIILSALVFLSQTVIANQDYALQKSQALNIAQKNIERIRQMRDTNYIDDARRTSSWDSFVETTNPNINTAPVDSIIYKVNPKTAPLLHLNTFILQLPLAANNPGFIANNQPVDLLVTNYPAENDNNVQYYSTISFLTDNKTDYMLISPTVNYANGNVVAYRVTCTVYWNYKGSADLIGDMKKVQIAELITDVRPRF